MSSVAASKYTLSQIVLHWIIVALVMLQYATSESVARTHQVSIKGLTQDSSDLFWHTVHNRSGLLILGLMMVRIGLRWYHGAPPAPVGISVSQAKAASIVHALLYGCLILQPLSGFVASYIWWPASIVHGPLFNLFAGLVALHILAAFWHQFVRHDGLLRRILP